MLIEEILAGIAVLAFSACVVYTFYMLAEEVKSREGEDK